MLAYTNNYLYFTRSAFKLLALHTTVPGNVAKAGIMTPYSK